MGAENLRGNTPGRSWFAINDPVTNQGVIVKRVPTPGISVTLWLDYDAGSLTNVSSALMHPPPGGFTSAVTETEKFCFYTASSWPQSDRTSLILPPGC